MRKLTSAYWERAATRKGNPRVVQLVAVGGRLEVAQDVDSAAEVSMAHAGRERASPKDRAPVSDGHARRRWGLELCSQ